MERSEEINYLSLFTGIGGIEEGIQSSIPHAKSIGYSEIDKYANMVLRKKYPEVKNYGDCTKINPEELPDFNILVGGFPCQSFSIAGKRMGFEDTRGSLFFTIANIAKIKRPRILWLENVKGLLNHEEGKTFAVILNTLAELGYDAEWEVCNSKYFGVPQNRERTIIIGYLGGFRRRKVFPLRGTDQDDNAECEREKKNPGGLKQLNENASQGYRVYDTEGVSQTIASGAGGMGAKTGLYEVKALTETRTEDAKKARKESKAEGKDYTPFRGKELKEREDDVANCLTATQTKEHLLSVVAAEPVLTPDRLEKRQNGRRIKGKNDPSFTLTAQDRHGVVVHSLQTRNPDIPSLKKNPKSGGSGHISKVDQAYCLDTGVTQAVQIEKRIRRLTPIECERLQGFPDDWTKYGINEAGENVEISDNQRYKMLGNAVTVNVMEAIGKKINIILQEWEEKSESEYI